MLVVTLAALAALVGYFALRPERPLLWLPTGMLVGGAIGNLIDRIAHGAVTDFIKLPHWPAFNVADMSITFGVLTLLYVLEGQRAAVSTERQDRADASPEAAAGTRLDRFLAVPLGSRARAQTLIDAGRVHGRRRAPRPSATWCSAGEAIEIDDWRRAGRGRRRAAGRCSSAVAYEDEHLLVVDKPAGVVVHPARGHRAGTLAQALDGPAAGGEEPWRAGIVHRLDRDTSGLLVVAKSDAVHRALKALLAARRLRREYLALVDGHPPAQHRARSTRRSAATGATAMLMSIDTDEPREARTHFEIERLLPAAALLRVTLETGRTHQIRVHMAAIGHPVSGDPPVRDARQLGLERQFLHAARLAFEHPVTGEPIDVTLAELPERSVRALELALGAWRELRSSQSADDSSEQDVHKKGGAARPQPPRLTLRTEPPEVGEGRFGPRTSHRRR